METRENARDRILNAALDAIMSELQSELVETFSRIYTTDGARRSGWNTDEIWDGLNRRIRFGLLDGPGSRSAHVRLGGSLSWIQGEDETTRE